MYRTLLAILAVVVLAGCTDEDTTSPPLGGGITFQFTTIAVDGAVSTTVNGINVSGAIVGVYVDEAGREHGFVRRDGTITTIDYPGAEHTDARGINRAGEIVGSFTHPGEPGIAFHGYRLTAQGEFRSVAYPGHLYIIPQRILDDGTILGCRHDEDFSTTMRGIAIRNNGESSETDAFASMHNGATPGLRRIVGLYMNEEAGRGEGYMIDDGVFTSLFASFPGINRMRGWDVSPAGDVVGTYRASDGNGNRIHGFVLTEGEFVSVDIDGAIHTRVFGINEQGEIVGSFTDADGTTNGFLASPVR